MTLSEHAGPPTLFPTTLIAYRVWRYTAYRIHAFKGTLWPKGWLNARCTKLSLNNGISFQTFADSKDHQAPVDDCSCGIYTRWRPDDLEDLAGLGFYKTDGVIAGAVEIKGVILPGYRGARVQQARIRAICPVNALDLSLTLPTLADSYQVPFFASMRELVAHFPPENLDALGIKKEPEIDYASIEMQQYLAAMMQVDTKVAGEILEKFKTANGQYVIPAGSLGSDTNITMSSDGIMFTTNTTNTVANTSLYPYWHYMTGRSTGKSAFQNIFLGTIT